MGSVHNQLRRTPLGAALKRALGDQKGSDQGLERYGETMQPVIDLWRLPEWSTIRLERLSAVRIVSGAVVGENSAVALCNPLNSNSLVVVEAVTVLPASALTIIAEVVADTVIAATLTTVATPGSQRDRRFGGGNPGRAFLRVGSDTGTTFGAQLEHLTSLGTAAAQSTTQAVVAVPIILQPGDDLLLMGQGNNVAFTASLKWRERAAFPGELG